MAKKTIHVDVAPDGSVKIEAFGYRGKGCAEATEAIEDALGARGDRKRKPEWAGAEEQAAAKVKAGQ